MQRFRHTFIVLQHLLAFLLSFASFFLIFGAKFDFLLRPSRTFGITAMAFVVVYLLMGRVYGGFDIGEKKSKPIIYSFVISLFATDLITHLFLCTMNTTIVNEGRFVYEAPYLLLLVYILQILGITVLAYAANGIYFLFNKPAKCLIVKHESDSADHLIRKVNRLKKQYQVEKVCNYSDWDILDQIDKADSVFLYNLAASERTPLVAYCYQQRKEIFYSIEMVDIVSMGSTQMLFDDKPMIHYTVKGLTFEQRIVKRAMDLAVSAVGLIIASPIMLATAAAIKLEDGGPVFYQQPRVTYAGRVFNVLKFRSMRVEDGQIHRSATKIDDRITKVGRVIRKFRIDELPQLINILRSDMSLVGPRPEMVENAQKYSRDLPAFAYRLRAKAGLTGMAQIYGKYNTSPADKLALDLSYIENYSILLDIKLILRTVMVLFTPEESTEEFDTSDMPEEQAEPEEAPEKEMQKV